MIVKRNSIIVWLISALLIPMLVHAQDADRTYRMGVLSSPSIGYWRQSPNDILYPLRDYGYERGKNLSYIAKFGRQRADTNISELAAELIAIEPSVLVATDLDAAVALQQATQTIPIVILAEGDPIGSKLIASLAQPGGNVTGVYILESQLVGKRLELLKTIVPEADKVCLLRDHSYLDQKVWLAAQDAARRLGMESQLLEASDSSEELATAFSQILAAECNAIVMLTIFLSNGPMLIKQANENQIPVICGEPSNASYGVGCLLAYGPELDQIMERLAQQVDRIFKGTPPAEIPVEQATHFKLAINLWVAETLGIEIPPIVLMQAGKIYR